MVTLRLAFLALMAWGAPRACAEVLETEPTAEEHHRQGVRFHLQRRLDEAGSEYAKVLVREPSRPVTESEWGIVRRFAPRLMTVPGEPFPLKDAAAIVHPSERLIAYHLFWEDDIDFPDDNDPCDHEVVWIRYGPEGSGVEGIWTYFHGRILEGGPEALEDARANLQRARVDVQWGKHGSMPLGWERLSLARQAGDLENGSVVEGRMPLLDYNRDTWRRLTVEGRRSRDHAMARRLGWPEKFPGKFEDFVGFSRAVDPLALLTERRMVAVSRWNSAVINREFLAYNFRPKTEWPEEGLRGGRGAGNALALFASKPSLEDFRLPSKSVFDKAMPRYPNVWFLVDATLVGSYETAVRWVVEEIRKPMRLRVRETRSEGCDFEVRLEHLQPWEEREHKALQHSHAFHMRFYHSALSGAGLERLTLQTSSGPREFLRFAASAHYEVEHTNPNHADVEICPICGRTGAYAGLEGNLVEKVHDPLGLELLFDGTIREQVVRFEDDQPRPFEGMGALANRYAIERWIFPAATGDRNTLRIGILVMAPFPRR
jgi:hypothetical protein